MGEFVALTAATAGSFPPFINAEHQADGAVRLLCRGDRAENGDCGRTVVATFTAEEWADFIARSTPS